MRKKIAIVSSNFLSIKSFLSKSVEDLSKNNLIYIYTNAKEQENIFTNKNIKLINLPITRNVNLLNDLQCFIKLLFLIFKLKPDIIFTITPKGGLLGISTSFILNIRIRIHYYTGQVWVTREGIVKKLLKFVDKIIFKMSTDCLTDSNRRRDFLKVLANGSICGVDTTRFFPNLYNRKIVREHLNISQDTILLLFLGRLNKDKGILDLADVVNDIIEKDKKNISLLVVGPDEENIKFKIQKLCKNSIDKIHFIEFTNEPEKYMSAADIFCLPSYREGFGMAALEAGACALPVITSRIYGLIDAVKEDYTGLFHEVRNKEQIKKCIIKLIDNKELREKLGKQGRQRVLNEFEQKYVTGEFVKYIQSL